MTMNEDDSEIMGELQIAMKLDQRQQVLALKTWLPRIKIWYERANRIEFLAAALETLDLRMTQLTLDLERALSGQRLLHNTPEAMRVVAVLEEARKVAAEKKALLVRTVELFRKLTPELVAQVETEIAAIDAARQQEEKK